MKNIRISILVKLILITQIGLAGDDPQSNGPCNPKNQSSTINKSLDEIINVSSKIKLESEDMVTPTWEGLRPGDLLGTRLYIPISVQNNNQTDQISIQSSSTNSWSPAVPIDGMKLYSADGTVRTFNIKYSENIDPKNHIYLNLNAFVLSRGNTILDDMMFTSDRSIEAIHSLIGANDPFQRKNSPMGEANFQVTDEKGRVFKMSAGQSMLGTLDLGYIRSIQLMKSGDRVITLNMGATGSASLNSLDSRPAVGLNQQLTTTQKINTKESVSLVLNAAGVYNLPVYLNKNSPHFADHSLDYNYGAALLFVRQNKNGGKTTFGIELAGSPPPLEHQPELKKEASAVKYGLDPKSPNRGFVQTKMALTRDEQLFGFGISREAKSGVTLEGRYVEDMNLAGGGLSGANNRQDFSFYMTVSASTDALKKLFKKKHPTIPLD